MRLSDTNASSFQALQRLRRQLRLRGITRLYYATPVAKAPANHHLAIHDRLALPLRGCHRMVISTGSDSCRTITPCCGEAVFMPTSCWNIPDWELPVDTITLILDEHTYRTHNVVTPGSQTSAVLHVHSNGTTPGVETRQLMELCRNILARNSEDERGPYLAISLALTALKELISSPSNTLPGKSGSTWQAIDRYLQQHCGQIVDRDQVAHFFRLSPNYISTLCRDKTGHTFNYHLTSIRMERAISLLQSGEYTIAEIGSFCGYSDPSYFGRVFRKHFGTSPGRFCVARCKTTLTPEVTKNLS